MPWSTVSLVLSNPYPGRSRCRSFEASLCGTPCPAPSTASPAQQILVALLCISISQRIPCPLLCSGIMEARG